MTSCVVDSLTGSEYEDNVSIFSMCIEHCECDWTLWNKWYIVNDNFQKLSADIVKSKIIELRNSSGVLVVL